MYERTWVSDKDNDWVLDFADNKVCTSVFINGKYDSIFY